MSTIAEVLQNKSGPVHTIADTASVLEAVHRMNDLRVGALMVTDPDGEMRGIVSERDVLRCLHENDGDVSGSRVIDVMTREVIVCTPQTPIREAQILLQQRRIRHLPVVGDGGKLAGLVSIGDINAHHLDRTQIEIRYMQDYVEGRV